jgi:hypothetical protein
MPDFQDLKQFKFDSEPFHQSILEAHKNIDSMMMKEATCTNDRIHFFAQFLTAEGQYIVDLEPPQFEEAVSTLCPEDKEIHGGLLPLIKENGNSVQYLTPLYKLAKPDMLASSSPILNWKTINYQSFCDLIPTEEAAFLIATEWVMFDRTRRGAGPL